MSMYSITWHLFFILTSSTGVYKHNNAVHLFKMVEFYKYAEIFVCPL